MKVKKKSIQTLSVIVPENPFSPDDLRQKGHCLCALNIEKLIEWWPGTPHSPHRKPEKVTSIQRSLDWKRVAAIAAYLLQCEIYDTDEKIKTYFTQIYEPKKHERGREWPPRVKKVTKYEKSEFPVFSNVLLHVNGAEIKKIKVDNSQEEAAHLIFDENDEALDFFVIDGQHRINGAYLALCLLKEQKEKKNVHWEIPAQIFLNLDPVGAPPKRQAQIFIDVNFYQKKVDRSLVADLFPTTRVGREALTDQEKAQDIGRKLMLDVGPLVGMIQIPGIKYGVKDVVTLSTLNSAIQDIMVWLRRNGIEGLELQTDFLAQILTAWFEATGRFEDSKARKVVKLDSENVVYQGRVLVSVLALMPAIIWRLKEERIKFLSKEAAQELKRWFKDIIKRAKLEKDEAFITRKEFKQMGYLGSGGIALFRDTLWASIRGSALINFDDDAISARADKNRDFVYNVLGKD